MGKELESEAEIIAFEIEENEPNLARESIRSSCLRPRVELLMAMPWDLFLSFREAD
jgi:predicted O-methyltransferase YrrM